MRGTMNNNAQDNSKLSIMLEELKVKGNFEGIILANRNGEIINDNIGKNTDSRKLASMCASVFESAVGLGETMGSQKIIKIIAELEKSSILMVEIKDKKVFLIFIINDQSNSSFIFNQLEDSIHKLSVLV
jgi:predicted regulator of Ras-like GTPase activity (Roadblock/LC7/MglB family)